MNRMIPELKGHEKTTLYIIGNGFDIFHGLKTSYKDFYEWLIANNCGGFVSDMEKMFPQLSDNELLLWKDFEEAMDKFKLIDIHRNFFQGKNNLYDETAYKSVQERINLSLRDIPKFLRQWLSEIDVFDTKPLLNLSSNSLYFSFNYTMLLEYCYSIPNNRILHIHKHLEENVPLITGHKSAISEYAAEDFCKDYIEQQSTQLIAKEMNKLVKPVEQLIKQYQSFFKSLNGISHIVVFGHSLSQIDKPYIKEILKNIQDYSCWYFITKDDNGILSIQEYVKQYNDFYRNHTNGFVIGDETFKDKMIIENCKFYKTANIETN